MAERLKFAPPSRKRSLVLMSMRSGSTANSSIPTMDQLGGTRSRRPASIDVSKVRAMKKEQAIMHDHLWLGVDRRIDEAHRSYREMGISISPDRVGVGSPASGPFNASKSAHKFHSSRFGIRRWNASLSTDMVIVSKGPALRLRPHGHLGP
jgi:hypothetical protein